MKNKILVISPHPDDEVLGCGGTIAKYSDEGDEVYLCIVTKAYTPDWSMEFIENRPEEVKKANRILGIKKTYFLDFPTVKLDTIPQKDLNEAISKVINEIKPDIVYFPHKGDLNKDHRLVFESSLVATRPLHHKIKRILSYECLSETEWGQSIEAFNPNVYVDITKTLKTKIEAMKVYESEVKPHPHPRSLEMINILAKMRGGAVGLEAAESFILIREII